MIYTIAVVNSAFIFYVPITEINGEMRPCFFMPFSTRRMKRRATSSAVENYRTSLLVQGVRSKGCVCNRLIPRPRVRSHRTMVIRDFQRPLGFVVSTVVRPWVRCGWA